MYDENLIPEKGRAIGMDQCVNCGCRMPIEEISENDLCDECESAVI